LTNIAVGLDTGFDYPPDLMRPLFELPLTSYQTAHGKTKQIVGARQHDKAKLLTEKIDGRPA
jgi:hypothetical protein